MPFPEPQQSCFFHLDPLLERKLCLYGSEFILVAEEAELDTVVSSTADDIVSARADFVKQVRCMRGETADWSSEGVRAADADGLVHVAHGDCMGISQKW